MNPSETHQGNSTEHTTNLSPALFLTKRTLSKHLLNKLTKFDVYLTFFLLQLCLSLLLDITISCTCRYNFYYIASFNKSSICADMDYLLYELIKCIDNAD